MVVLMSATNRSDVRVADDFYSTPKWATLSIKRVLDDRPWADMVDPCAGDGAILDVFGDLGTGIEINRDRAMKCGTRCQIGDALAPERDWGEPDLIVTNPPFSLAMAFAERALDEVREGGTVALLLRLSWLASGERKTFHEAHPCDVYVMSRRPAFAASLKCKPKEGRSCGWHVMQALDAERVKACPDCGSHVSVTTSDSADYGWFVFGPGRGNRWFMLEEVGS